MLVNTRSGLIAPSHYLHQCWLLIIKIPRIHLSARSLVLLLFSIIKMYLRLLFIMATFLDFKPYIANAPCYSPRLWCTTWRRARTRSVVWSGRARRSKRLTSRCSTSATPSSRRLTRSLRCVTTLCWVCCSRSSCAWCRCCSVHTRWRMTWRAMSVSWTMKACWRGWPCWWNRTGGGYWNSLALGRVILKASFSNSWYWRVAWALGVELLSGDCLRTSLLRSEHWFR